MRIFVKGMWIIFLCSVTAISIAVYYNVTAEPVYEASALIMLKKDGGVQKALFNDPVLGESDVLIHNHMEILKSRTLAKDVVKRLQETPGADSLGFLHRSLQNERFSINRWISTTFSRNRRSRFAGQNDHFDYLVETFRNSCTTVIPKDQTDIIELRVEAYDPYEAALLANTWMEAYQDLDLQESKGEISEVRAFLENKLVEVQRTLAHSEDALKEYKQSEGVTELNAETQQMIQQLAQFETAYEESRTELEANERRLAYLKAQLDEKQRNILDQAAQASSSVIQELERTMAEMIASKAAYEQQLKGAGYYSADDPKLKQMDQRLKGLQVSIADEKRKLVSGGTSSMNPIGFAESLIQNILTIETENKSLKAKADAYAGILQRYNLHLNTLPEKSLNLARFQREAEVNNSIFMMLRSKYEESRISEAGQIGSIRIVDYAEPPKEPIRPDRVRNLLSGILCGLGLGVGILLFREYLDRSVKTIEDIERLGFPVLGSIPVIASRQVGRRSGGTSRKMNQIESRLVTHFQPNSPVSESYRTLRTNIQYSNVDKPLKTVLVTSPGPGEGKSTSVANLAITFAQMGAKVLLVDTDLRRPVLNGLSGFKRNEGLTNVLVRAVPLSDAVRRTRIRNLYVLTSGTIPKNPSEFLASKVMRGLLKEVSSRFDIVLLDSPPVIAVTDSAVLSSCIDGVIIVVRSEQTDRDALLRAVTLLKNVNAKLLGMLLNHLDIRHQYGSYYKYYTYK
jgi:tyrosine-protein kinase Etk/Wzc